MTSTIAHEFAGLPLGGNAPLIVWGHGWAHNRNVFKPIVESLASRASHLLLDLPGFGESPVPPADWGTAEVADAVATLIRPYRTGRKIIWVGHSYGGRIGIQLVARHGELVDGLFLIASAGLPRRRGFWGSLRLKAKVYAYKTAKLTVVLFPKLMNELKGKFGSPDYQKAGPLRDMFLRAIRENLTEEARKVACPVQLVYGANDKETPPEVGERLSRLMPRATLTVWPDHDHLSLLGSGRHLVAQRLAAFMEMV